MTIWTMMTDFENLKINHNAPFAKSGYKQGRLEKDLLGEDYTGHR